MNRKGRCVCRNWYEGCDHDSPCQKPNDGTGRGPWCAECQPRRLASITKGLEDIQRGAQS